jgi:spore coat polysaccharide biosynthesis predicted glycosyltransferase SpsG
MKIYFRCRGGTSHGWGDVVRLSLIADKLYKKRKDVIFIYEGDNYIKNYLNNFRFKKIRLQENISIQEEIRIINKLKKASHIFIEMLEISLNLQKFYKTKTKKLIILDDILDKKYYSDYTISCQNHKNIKSKLIRSKNNKIFINSNFFPFSDEIKQQSKFKKNKIKLNSSLLIFLGGGDYSDAYIKIAKSLKDFDYEKITLVTSKSNFKNIRNKIKKIDKNIFVLDGVKKVGKLFNEHDTAIVAGGYTKYEAAVMGVPCMIISTQWHQKHLSNNFCKDTGCDHVGHYSRIAIKDIGKSLNELSKTRRRKKIISNYKKIVSLKGLNKILSTVGIK